MIAAQEREQEKAAPKSPQLPTEVKDRIDSLKEKYYSKSK